MKRRLFALLIAPLIFAACPWPLQAQEPAEEDTVEEQPASLLPVTVEPPGSVSVAATSDVPADNFGLLDPDKSGFEVSAWEGIPYDRAVMLVENVPQNLQSRVLRSLSERLLATKMEAPHTDKNAGALLETRIRTLFMMGDGEKALAMIAALPAPMVSEAIRQTKVEALLLKPDTDAACADVKTAIETYDTLYWQRMVIFCQALSSNHDGAQLGLNLLKEQNRAPDDYFLSVIGSFQDNKTPITLPDEMTTADEAMLLATGRADMIEPHLETLDIPALTALSADQRFSPALRAHAAELATARGISARTVADLYTALSEQKKDDRPEMVDIYRRMTRERSLSPKIERTIALADYFSKAHARAGAYSLLHFIVREIAARPQVKLMPPDFVFHALNVLWLANMEREANSLITRLSAANSRVIDTALYKEIAAGMSALLTETSPITGLSTKAMNSITDVTPQRDAAHALRLLAVLSALGYDTGESAAMSADVFDYSHNVVAPSADLMKEFKDAVGAHRKAEAVLLATHLMGDTSFEQSSDETIAAIVSGLSAIGFDKEARTFAREAVIYTAM